VEKTSTVSETAIEAVTATTTMSMTKGIFHLPKEYLRNSPGVNIIKIKERCNRGKKDSILFRK